MSRFNPYKELKTRFRDFVKACYRRQRKVMQFYEKKALEDGAFRLDTLHAKVRAAHDLGYEVHLTAEDNRLVVEYVQKLPDEPCIL